MWTLESIHDDYVNLKEARNLGEPEEVKVKGIIPLVHRKHHLLDSVAMGYQTHSKTPQVAGKEKSQVWIPFHSTQFWSRIYAASALK